LVDLHCNKRHRNIINSELPLYSEIGFFLKKRILFHQE
jgi:hypothetical protein